MDRESRNNAFHSSLNEPWEGAGEAMLKHAQEKRLPFINMQMQPKHGMTGKSLPGKTVGEMEARSGQAHIEGSGLATGRVSKRLREQQQGGNFVVRPSIRSQLLADTEDTFREHDMAPGMSHLVAPEHIEDMEVRQAGLPPLRATSRAGFMSGLGSVAAHKQEARAFEARLPGLQQEHRNAKRRLASATVRGDNDAIAQHQGRLDELAGQIKETQGFADHHNQAAHEIAQRKVGALQMLKDRSTLDLTGHPSWGAAAMAAHREMFDPETKEEFYPIASQHQLADVAEASGTSHIQATNVTGMLSAQRAWRRRDPETDEVSHPNLAMAHHISSHFNSLLHSGQLDEAERNIRAGADQAILAKRSSEMAKIDEKTPLKSGAPRPISTEITDADREAHVHDALVDHVARTLPSPSGGVMPPSHVHARQAAGLLLARTPEEMADEWAKSDHDKRPTFALALAATHANRSVRRQSMQAVTADTHYAKMAGVNYKEVLGTGAGMHVTGRQEIPHQLGKSVQPAYNVLAMLGSRMALRETAQRLKAGMPGVSPRYAQENPWGLFAAENMADVAAARRNKAAGGTGQVRERSSGYYRAQGGDEELRSFKTQKRHPMAGRQFTDEELLGS